MYLKLIRCYLKCIDVNQDVLDSLTVCYQSLEAHLMFCAKTGNTMALSAAPSESLTNNNIKKIHPRAISRDKKAIMLLKF